MEKLIVKNFGPIKEAEIDLTKYVVFIGDTSTGKSVLAKLIAIFRDNDIIFSTNREKQFVSFLRHYNIDFELQNTYILYQSKGVKIIFDNSKLNVYDDNGKLFAVNESDANMVNRNGLISFITDIQWKMRNENNSENEIIKLHTLLDEILELNKKIPQTDPIYFPAERLLVSLIGSSISGLWANNVALPPYFKDFAAKFEVSRKHVGGDLYQNMELIYLYESGIDYIVYQGHKLKLSESSSGIQSLLPLLLVLDYELHYSSNRLKRTLVIEEPELNLFPIKQKAIIEHISQRVNKTICELIITTHSPYILSVLDTLMLAKNTFNEHPHLKDEIAAIVSEDKWIDYNDISVYEVKNDGTIKSIKNEEFKSIDTNAIDGVSDIISEQFDKLTELRYAQ